MINNETARKLVHMLHALAVTVWAYFLPVFWPLIVVEAGSLAVVLIAKHLNMFNGFSKVGRLSYGELLLPLGIMIICLLSPTYPQFVVVMAHAGLADALAALVGRRFKSVKYRLFGQTKTLTGSATFFAVSLLSFSAYLAHSGRLDVSMMPSLVIASLLVTATEAASVYGTDNLTIPLATFAVLTMLL